MGWLGPALKIFSVLTSWWSRYTTLRQGAKIAKSEGLEDALNRSKHASDVRSRTTDDPDGSRLRRPDR